MAKHRYLEMHLKARVYIVSLIAFGLFTLLLFYGGYWPSENRVPTVEVEREEVEETQIAEDDKKEEDSKLTTKPVTSPFMAPRGAPSPSGQESCRLPVLDPYHVDVMKYIEKLTKPVCTGKRYGRFEGRDFLLTASNVRDISIRIIRRPTEDDFSVDTSKVLGLTKHPKNTLSKGRYGCLGVGLDVNRIVAPKGEGDDTTYAALKPQECTYDAILKFSDDGKIMDLASRRCLFVRRNRLLFRKCSKGYSSFRFDGNGHIWYEDRHLWGLWSKTYCVMAKQSDDKWKLILAKQCKRGQPSSTFYILEAEAKDVNLRLRVDEEAFFLYVLEGDDVHRELHYQAVRQKVPSASISAPKSIPLNIILLMFDSQSNANFQRAMPKTMATLRTLDTSFHFKGHTIVGDGTTAQLCAMLTGVAEEDLPEARRNFENSDFVDRWPFIFSTLSKHGYKTMFTDDQPSSASFNMRLHGFKNQPTDHYGRPFWMIAENLHSNEYCIMDRFSHQYNFEYLKSYVRAYPTTKTFSLIITSDICHNSVNPMQLVDDDLEQLINTLQKEGQLNSSLLVIFGDHGNRVSEFRETLQGKLEERLPFLSISLPGWMWKTHPDFMAAMQQNTGVLTSHFDVYHTMRDVLGIYKGISKKDVGQSLFRLINNRTRTCATAGIDDHWCPCLVFRKVNVRSKRIRSLAKSAVTFMNNLISAFPKAKELCHTLRLGKVLKAGKREPSSKVQRFANTKTNDKCDSCDIEYNEKPSHSSTKDYELLFDVKPSGGRFEVNVKVKEGKVVVDPRISRTNRYGKQPNCIEKDFPSIRKYCLCKK